MIEYDRFSHLFTHIWPYLPLSRGIVQEGEERIYSFTCQLLPSQAPKSTATGGAPWPPRSSTADLAAPPREACLGEQMAGSMPPSPDPRRERHSLVLLGFVGPPPPGSMEGAWPCLTGCVLEHRAKARGLGGLSEWCRVSSERCRSSSIARGEGMAWSRRRGSGG